jgi:DNA polymerase III subunit gamma/tau
MSTQVPASTPHQALYRRWRAQTFGQLVGQDAVVETLRNAVRLGKLSHGLLFVGPRGTGKTSMARIVAKAVNCLAPVDGEPDDSCEPCAAIRDGRALDVVELDAASNNRVDDMRELLPRVYTAPADLRHKVFIIDEVQRIKEGWDVLLKTLEEPPDDVLFIFCTTDPSGIRPAVVSRLQRYSFRPLPAGQIEAKLRRIVEAEGRSVTDEALGLVAARAAGGMRDAESMLDQVLAGGSPAIDADMVRQLLGLAEAETVDRFIDALAGDQPLVGVRLLDELEGDGRDLVAFADQVVDALRGRLVAVLAEGERGSGRAAVLAAAARRLSQIDVNRGAAGGYRLQLELALLEAAVSPTAQAGPAPTLNRQMVPPAPTEALPAASRSTAPASAAGAVQEAEPLMAAQRAAPARAAQRTESARAAQEADPPGPSRANSSSAEAPAQPAEKRSPQRPEPARPIAATAASGDTTPSAVSLERLLEAWSQVVEQVGANPANRPLIMACRPIEVRDGSVVLGFPEDQLFLRDIAERKRGALEDGLSRVLGARVGVRIVAANVELPRTEPVSADALVAQARRVFADDVLDVAEVE